MEGLATKFNNTIGILVDLALPELTAKVLSWNPFACIDESVTK